MIQVVPLTSTIRGFASEVRIELDPTNGLDQLSAAQCQHVRAVSPGRAETVRGNIGPVALAQLRDVIAVLLDLPS